jgi:hypothetical protein
MTSGQNHGLKFQLVGKFETSELWALEFLIATPDVPSERRTHEKPNKGRDQRSSLCVMNLQYVGTLELWDSGVLTAPSCNTSEHRTGGFLV